MKIISTTKATKHDDIGTLRVIIPKEIRELLKIKKGDLLIISTNGKVIQYQKASQPHDSVKESK